LRKGECLLAHELEGGLASQQLVENTSGKILTDQSGITELSSVAFTPNSIDQRHPVPRVIIKI
jgi:hypothetical protein